MNCQYSHKAFLYDHIEVVEVQDSVITIRILFYRKQKNQYLSLLANKINLEMQDNSRKKT